MVSPHKGCSFVLKKERRCMNNAFGRTKKQKKNKTYNFCHKLAKYQRSLSQHHTDGFYIWVIFLYRSFKTIVWTNGSLIVFLYGWYKIKVVPKELCLDQLWVDNNWIMRPPNGKAWTPKPKCMILAQTIHHL